MATRRLFKDLAALQKSENPQLIVRPSNDMLQWHFLFHSLPSESPYYGGCYHGKIIFPEEYPLKPPAIVMLTPSGRFEVGVTLCLSMTDYHPESWNPAWSVETLLVGLLSVFLSDKEMGRGSLRASLEMRQRLAKTCWETNAQDLNFRDLFPEFLAPPQPLQQPPCPPSLMHKDHDGSSFQSVTAQEHDGIADADVAVPVQEDEDEEAPGEGENAECWICREGDSLEPLIQPCGCRGSMSRVHASCVEHWIARHRQDALSSSTRNHSSLTRTGHPRCPVCGQPYDGEERRPRLARLIAHAIFKALLLAVLVGCPCRALPGSFRIGCVPFRVAIAWLLMQASLLRSLVFLVLLFGFWWVNMLEEYRPGADGWRVRLPLQVTFTVLFSLFFLYKIVVTIVSSPTRQRHRPGPPRNSVLRLFFVGDKRALLNHWLDVISAVFFLFVFGCTLTLDPVKWLLPYFTILMLGVASNILAVQGARRLCLFTTARLVICCSCVIISLTADYYAYALGLMGYDLFLLMVVPGIIMITRRLRPQVQAACRHPIRLLHPLNAGLQMLLVILSVCMLAEPNNLYILSVWCSHSLLLLFGLAEQLLIRRLRWYRGPAWWLLVLLTVATAFIASNFYSPSSGFAYPSDDLHGVVRAASFVWLGLVAGLAMKTNWNSVARWYQQWQQRHSQFRLHIPHQQDVRDMEGRRSEEQVRGNLQPAAVVLLGSEATNPAAAAEAGLVTAHGAGARPAGLLATHGPGS